MPDHDDVVREAIRFAEEYGYNRWQEARDHYTALEAAVDNLRSLYVQKENERVENEQELKQILLKNYAEEEDIATINELSPLQAYERGVLDVQEDVAAIIYPGHDPLGYLEEDDSPVASMTTMPPDGTTLITDTGKWTVIDGRWHHGEVGDEA